jgi:hypothetical protein
MAERPAAWDVRTRLFVALCAGCALLALGYIGSARLRTAAAVAAPAVSASGDLSLLGREPVVVFRNLVPGEGYGAVGIVPLERADAPRAIAPLRCDRVYFAGGRGLCLSDNLVPFWSPPSARAFDASFTTGAEFPVGEVPSRARVAPDGRLGAMTGFVRGDSYAADGFSTRTSVLDLVAGRSLGDLETFEVRKDGAPIRAVDVNFWGVTFAGDGNRFYATVATGGTTYLIEGDLASRSARTLRENVECPSLSPDGSRIVFKKKVGPGEDGWRLHALDLQTLVETPLPESRSVDDQAEWLDDRHVLYGLMERVAGGGTRTDVWVVAVDGAEPPRVYLPQASSPSVVRPVAVAAAPAGR